MSKSQGSDSLLLRASHVRRSEGGGVACGAALYDAESGKYCESAVVKTGGELVQRDDAVIKLWR